jgi:hypothetical protein
MGILASDYAHTIEREREREKKTGSVRLSNFMSNSRRLYPKKGIDSHKLDSVMHLISWRNNEIDITNLVKAHKNMYI